MKTWTQDEVRDFKRWYGGATDYELSTRFGCSVYDIKTQARLLCLSKNKATIAKGYTKMPRWTEEELKLLKDNYPSTPNLKLARKIGRSLKSVVSKAHDLGLKKSQERLQQMGRENIRLRNDRSGHVLTSWVLCLATVAGIFACQPALSHLTGHADTLAGWQWINETDSTYPPESIFTMADNVPKPKSYRIAQAQGYRPTNGPGVQTKRLEHFVIVVPIVQVGSRFDALVKSCEAAGGWYAHKDKERGTPWGFAFKHVEDAQDWARIEMAKIPVE